MTRKMHEIEQREGKSIEQVLNEKFEQYETQDSVAKALGVSQGTIWSWLKYLGLRQKTVLVPNRNQDVRKSA